MSGEVKKTPFLVLELLQKKTNEEHHLQQKEIVELLKRDYDITVNRKTVAEDVKILRELNYDIAYEDGYYLTEKPFSNEELRYLIDSVFFSKNLTKSQGKRLLDKIKKLGDEYFQQEIPVVKTMPGGIGHSDSASFMYSVSVLHQAIAKKKKVEFSYMRYGTDLKQHSNGKRYVVSPYYMVAANGHYFLMCSYDNHDNMAVSRIDRIKDIVILEEKVKSRNQISDYMEGKDLPKHLAEHIYMFNGPSLKITIKTTDNMMSDLVDWFGRDIKVEQQEGQDVTVSVNCNERAMFYWLLQYGMSVEVLEPASLRQQMQEAAKTLYKKYKN